MWDNFWRLICWLMLIACALGMFLETKDKRDMDKEKIYKGLHRFRHPVLGYPTANGALIYYDSPPHGTDVEGWYAALVHCEKMRGDEVFSAFVDGTQVGPFHSAEEAYKKQVWPKWIEPNMEKGL